MNHKKLKIGVIGAGSMGSNHVRIYSELKEIDEVFVFDQNYNTCANVCQSFSAKAVDSLKELLICDAVSIAAPTEFHAEIAAYFLSNGKHCLIEKPLTDSRQDAEKILNLARDNNVLLMVGHVEHFNPAFIELKKIINNGIQIYSIESRRLSYARPNLDKTVDVVFDLMIHDLELVISLLGDSISSVSAHHIAGLDPWGHVNALLKTESGVIANFSASRITQHKIRTMALNTDIGFFSLDFIKQELTLYKSGLTEKLNDLEGSLFKLDISADKILVRNEEPLRVELKHFLSCILNGHSPIVSGELGRDAVELAEIIKRTALDG